MAAARKVIAIAFSVVVGFSMAYSVVAFASDTPSPAVASAAQEIPALADGGGSSAGVPAGLRDLAGSGKPDRVADSQFEGTWQLDRAVHLVADQRFGSYVVALPTDRGQVCYAVVVPRATESWGGGCVAQFSAGRPVAVSVYDPDLPTSGLPAVVGGIYGSNVTTVGIVVNGKVYAATLQNGGLIYQLDDAASYPEAIRVTTEQGTATLAIPDPRAAMAAAGN